jgi:CubicO group peptidase (beta-lactamase class C family)
MRTPSRSRKTWTNALLACLVLAHLSLAKAATPDEAARVQAAADGVRDALVDLQAIPGAVPAVMAVVVQGDATPLRLVRGKARAGESAPVDRDSHFYIASQTKSFMGLLGAHLDETGVLPLDTTLADVWPGLALPAPADAAAITMADLLSHEEGLKTDTLNFLTAYVRAVPAADYPSMLARYTEAREPGFRYANLGDLVYGAALEARTGKPWQAWLDEAVLRPLGLDHTHSRTSAVSSKEQTWNHRWDGSAWHPSPPKPDALMHAAGGLTATADDLAAWMRVNLQRRSPTGTPSAASFERAQRPVAEAKLSDGEFVCDGYSLGWYACGYRGERVLMHPGSYVGVTSVTLLLPQRDAGLSLAFTSDSAIEGLALELMKGFIGVATGHADDAARLRKAVADYPARLERTVASRSKALAEARAEANWNGWTWKPSADEFARYAGTFRSERLGDLDVRATPSGLEARLGALALTLEPASEHLFGATDNALAAPEPLRYAATTDAIEWKDTTFVRVPAPRE